MSNVTEQSFSASPSARAFTIRTLETSALKFSTTLTLLLSSWNTITGSVGISNKKKWNEKVKTTKPPMKRKDIRPSFSKIWNTESDAFYPGNKKKNCSAWWRFDIWWFHCTMKVCDVVNAFKWIRCFSWAVTRVDCNQSLFKWGSSWGLARLERANEPRGKLERGTWSASSILPW